MAERAGPGGRSGLRTPILDDRSYAQLRDELIARIPVYAPEWTDHEPSDPGITLIELFAFLAENVLYRFNQIPDATRMGFLDLVQVPMRPAAAATGLTCFTTKLTTVPLVEQHTEVSAGPVVFETVDEISVLPVSGHAAIRKREPLPTDVETLEFVNRVSATLGRSSADVTTYRTTFGAADPNQPGGDTLDPGADTVDATLWVALVAGAAGDVDAARAALAGARISVGVVAAEDVPAMADVAPCPGGAGAPATPPMEWQISTTAVDPASTAVPPDPRWVRLGVEADSTAGLTGSGVVGVRLPDDVSEVGVYTPADPESTGAGDQPPLVDDDDLAARIVCWLRAFRPDGAAIPALDYLGVNAARIEDTRSAGPEFLGTGTGQPNQVARLVHPSVMGADVGLQVEEAGPSWVPWAIVEDFDASTVDSRHAVLDPAAGTVTFGDGLRGRVPQIGERIRTTGYRYGGGSAGNVAAAAVNKVGLTGVTVANPLATRGGADAETTAAAVDRIPGEIRRHDRAVTASDFSELAAQTPGADIVRAETLALFDPHNPTIEVPGAVTVVVWPGHDTRHPTAPLPTRSQLDAVCGYLDVRRLVTTELYVVPPTYRPVSVAVGIAVKPGYGTEAVRRWVEQLLRQYLSPLPPLGPDGGGWPLGRRVHGPELEAAALQVDGVEYLNGLRLASSSGVAGDPAGTWAELTPPTLLLAAYEVPDLVAVSVVPGDPLDPTAGTAAPQPAPPAVPIRAPREVC